MVTLADGERAVILSCDLVLIPGTCVYYCVTTGTYVASGPPTRHTASQEVQSQIQAALASFEAQNRAADPSAVIANPQPVGERG